MTRAYDQLRHLRALNVSRDVVDISALIDVNNVYSFVVNDLVNDSPGLNVRKTYSV